MYTGMVFKCILHIPAYCPDNLGFFSCRCQIMKRFHWDPMVVTILFGLYSGYFADFMNIYRIFRHGNRAQGTLLVGIITQREMIYD